MRLSELKPSWLTLGNWAVPDRPFYVGVSFDLPPSGCMLVGCATCQAQAKRRRVTLKFWPPIDPTQVAQDMLVPVELKQVQQMSGGVVFTRQEGEDFDSLSLEEPINITYYGWHGTLRAGELETGYQKEAHA